MSEPYMTPEELERVYFLIEGVLPEGWSIDQQSECISVTWPTESPAESALRCEVMQDIIKEITEGKHQTVLRHMDRFDHLVEERMKAEKEYRRDV